MHKTHSKSLLASLIAVLLCTAAAHCFAQGSTAYHPFRVQATLIYPGDEGTRNIVGDTLFGAGASYDFVSTKDPDEHPTALIPAIYVEGTGRTRDKGTQHLEASYIGLGISGRYYFGVQNALKPPPGQSALFYVGAGIGPYYGKYNLRNTLTNVVIVNEKYQWRFGGKLFVGADLGSVVFLEAGYTTPGTSRLNTWDFSLGARF